MTITVITSFSTEGYLRYGHRCITSFHKHWPKDIKLICYWEGNHPDGVIGYDLLSLEPCRTFLERHKGNPVVHGLLEVYNKPWMPLARRQGYSWRHDAYKFARKVFAIHHAARIIGGGKMFWLDADVETLKPVPHALLDGLLPNEASLSYLSRIQNQAEVGFVGFNLNRQETYDFLDLYLKQYTEDLFLKDNVWDDGWQFTLLLKKLKISTYYIPHRSENQPFDNSVLGEFMVHHKGPRKDKL